MESKPTCQEPDSLFSFWVEREAAENSRKREREKECASHHAAIREWIDGEWRNPGRPRHHRLHCTPAEEGRNELPSPLHWSKIRAMEDTRTPNDKRNEIAEEERKQNQRKQTNKQTGKTTLILF